MSNVLSHSKVSICVRAYSHHLFGRGGATLVHLYTTLFTITDREKTSKKKIKQTTKVMTKKQLN